MKIQPISFEKKYRKLRTGQKTNKQNGFSQTNRPTSEESKTELVKQANFALNEANKIKQIANSAKIKSFEIYNKAKNNIQYANDLYSAIKSIATTLDNNSFSVQFEGITYKVEISNGKCRAIGQSRGFFGKKDIFEYDTNKDKVTSVFKGYSKEKDSDTFTAYEEYHNVRGSILDVFYNTTTDKINKKVKEGFSFHDDKISSYKLNAKVNANDFDYGEFETILNYDSLFGGFTNCNIGLNCSKNAFTFKQGYHFTNGKLTSYIKNCQAKQKGNSSVCTNGLMIQYNNEKPEAGFLNYQVINEKANCDFRYTF